MDMIIQTRSLFSDIPRQISACRYGSYRVSAAVQSYLSRLRHWYRDQNTSALVLFHLSGKQDPRIMLLHRHFDKRIGLVILQHRIVFRTMLLDQVTLQHQCFQFRICHDIFKTPNLRHHLFDLGSLVPAGLKILPHPVFQTETAFPT